LVTDYWEVELFGTSMYPFLRHGDICFVQPHASKIEVSEIVCLRNKETKEIIIHRAVNVKNGQWLTKGDHALFYDDPKLHDTLGVVRLIKRNNKLLRLNRQTSKALLSHYYQKKTPKLLRVIFKFMIKII